MADLDEKEQLHRYLRLAREALVWKLDGLGDYDVRRPLTRTGTNLLGRAKHVASVEAGYLGEVFGRPFGEPMPWLDEDAEPNADMWATAGQPRAEIVEWYKRVWNHSDETIQQVGLADVGVVPWWPEERRVVTLQTVLIHLIAETNRHAGHADIVRELVDGAAGLSQRNDNMPPGDAKWWEGAREAKTHRSASGRARPGGQP